MNTFWQPKQAVPIQQTVFSKYNIDTTTKYHPPTLYGAIESKCTVHLKRPSS